MSEDKTVWLIGAEGFTGQYLYHALVASAYHVDTTQVDITSIEQLETEILKIRPDYIINLAAISFVPDGENEFIYAVNTFGAQNILNACLKLDKTPEKVILASSANVYGWQTQEIISETAIANPLNHYGCSKWSMEQIAKTYRDRLNIIITRPFNYTGQGQNIKFLVPKIVYHFQQKAESIQLGNIDIWRDFSDVRWVVQAYLALLQTRDEIDQPLNLCSGKLTGIGEMFDHLTQITGHDIKVKVNSAFVRSSDIKKQKGDNSLLYRLLPQLEPVRDFKQTLSWMLMDTLDEKANSKQ